MYRKHRSKLEIIDSLIKAVGSEGDKGGLYTHLMMKSQLPSSQTNAYLKLLLGSQILNYNTNTRRYNLTIKSAKFLNLYYEMKGLDVTGWLGSDES